MSSKIDRFDAGAAQEIIEALYPKLKERRLVLERLLCSAAAANAVAPNAWGVTLSPDGFRLNVGVAEVFVVGQISMFLNCSANADAEPFRSEECEPTDYRSVPQPQCRWWGTPDELATIPKGVLDAHLRFIDHAARAPSGKARTGTPLRRSHSEGLMKYAKAFMAGTSSKRA